MAEYDNSDEEDKVDLNDLHSDIGHASILDGDVVSSGMTSIKSS